MYLPLRRSTGYWILFEFLLKKLFEKLSTTIPVEHKPRVDHEIRCNYLEYSDITFFYYVNYQSVPMIK